MSASPCRVFSSPHSYRYARALVPQKAPWQAPLPRRVLMHRSTRLGFSLLFLSDAIVSSIAVLVTISHSHIMISSVVCDLIHFFGDRPGSVHWHSSAAGSGSVLVRHGSDTPIFPPTMPAVLSPIIVNVFN